MKIINRNIFLHIMHVCYIPNILGCDCWGPVSRGSHPDMAALGTLVAPFNHNHCILYFQLQQSPNIEPEICIEEKSILCCFQLLDICFNLRSCTFIILSIDMCSLIALIVLFWDNGWTMIAACHFD